MGYGLHISLVLELEYFGAITIGCLALSELQASLVRGSRFTLRKLSGTAACSTSGRKMGSRMFGTMSKKKSATPGTTHQMSEASLKSGTGLRSQADIITSIPALDWLKQLPLGAYRAH